MSVADSARLSTIEVISNCEKSRPAGAINALSCTNLALIASRDRLVRCASRRRTLPPASTLVCSRRRPKSVGGAAAFYSMGNDNAQIKLCSCALTLRSQAESGQLEVYPSVLRVPQCYETLLSRAIVECSSSVLKSGRAESSTMLAASTLTVPSPHETRGHIREPAERPQNDRATWHAKVPPDRPFPRV